MSPRLRLLAPVLALTLVAAACGGAASPSPEASPAPPSATPAASVEASPSPSAAATPVAICDDAAAFRASLVELTNLKLLEVGTSGVKAAVADVKASAEALLVSGKDLVAQPLTDLLAAVTALQATLTSLGDQPGLGAGVAAVRLAIEQIKAAAADVEAVLGTTCPAQ
jgi:iron complex transport system substrate-binding protein